MPSSALMLKSNEDIRQQRLRNNDGYSCSNIQVMVGWPRKRANIGTLVRLCDALQICLVITNNRLTQKVLCNGNTIGQDKICVHYIVDPDEYLQSMKTNYGFKLIALELAHNSVNIKDVPALKPSDRAILVLGNEAHGIPQDTLNICDQAIEVSMFGVGNSLNVITAASIVLYKLAGQV